SRQIVYNRRHEFLHGMSAAIFTDGYPAPRSILFIGGQCPSRRTIMPLNTKRWSDPVKKSDGFRLLICQSRPRAVAKDKENWDEWYPELGPSKELQTAFSGKGGTAISWEEFRSRYLEEMKTQEELIDGLADLVAEG